MVVVIHGGSERTRTPSWGWHPAIARMWPIAEVIRHQLPDVRVALLGFHLSGWNDDGADVLADTRWALERLRGRFPGRPIVLVGHSLGGRVVMQVGGDPDVVGVIGLAPWAPDGDPVEQLAGQSVVVLHGDHDREVSEPSERAFLAAAERAGARVSKHVLPGLGHTMVKRFRVWDRLTVSAVRRLVAEAGPVSPG